MDSNGTPVPVGNLANSAIQVFCVGGTCGGGGTQDVNVIQLLGVAPGAANPFPQRLSTGVAFYDARDRSWTLASGTDSVTVASITNPVAVTGTFFQATQPVSGTFFQATQPVSGPLTDAQLRAVPVPVSGTVTATGPLTDAQLRAVPVPVSGTVTIGTFPDNEPFNLAQVGGTATVNGGPAGSLATGGTAGNNAAITQNPNLIGCEAITYGTQPTAATTGNQRRVLCTTEGALAVTPGHNRFSCFVQAVTVTTQCQAAPAAWLRAYVLSVSISNQAATVQSPDIVFGTGANCVTGITALTHKWTMGTLATTTNSFAVNATFLSPLVPTAANAICIRPSAATVFGATITGYIAP